MKKHPIDGEDREEAIHHRLSNDTNTTEELMTEDDVDLDCIAKVTDGFSGADLNEICQRAIKIAINECIELTENYEKQKNDGTAPTEEFNEDELIKNKTITREHLEEVPLC